MIQTLFVPLKRILLQLLLLLGCYFISRCFFTIININHFEGLTIGRFFSICFFALRYDISALLVINSLYIVLALFPLPLWRLPRWEAFTQWIFVLTNAVALLFETSDWAYFPYNFKRSTADVLNMVSRKGDFLVLLPRFIIDYWYVPICWIALVWLLIRYNNRIRRKAPLYANYTYTAGIALGETVRLAIIAGLCLIGIRGGLQYVPIGIRNAVQVTDPKFSPIVINTPFSIINTFQNDEIPEVNYFTPLQLSTYFNTQKRFRDKIPNKKNVVVIIVESFSKEFTRLGGGVSYTPFIDSLMSHSFVCTQAYANALHSAEGIPAVVAGLPSLMDEPISTSIYSNDHISALPGLLKEEGYSSAFYHGGTNGTMSFDVFCANAGYDKYYGRSEYNNEQDYDGNWGIWDEPFLQYFAKGISKMKQPFLATVFTLSSHPPYKIPDQYKNTLPQDSLPIHEAIAYTDLALRKFFETASQQPWYKNTLFVITADHCSPMSGMPVYQGNMGNYAIPIIYYAPGDTALAGYTDKITQQIDILPSILDYLGYNKRFFAFGNSVFRGDTHPFAINYISNTYQLVINNYLLQTVNTDAKGLYAFPADSTCKNNLAASQPHITQDELNYLKALIQLYHYAIIHNQLWINDTKK